MFSYSRNFLEILSGLDIPLSIEGSQGLPLCYPTCLCLIGQIIVYFFLLAAVYPDERNDGSKKQQQSDDVVFPTDFDFITQMDL